MQEHDKMTDYLSTVTQRLKADGFKITENVIYEDRVFKYVAKRKRSLVQYLSFETVLFIFVTFNSIDWWSLREFSEKCFRYAKKSKSTPFPLGLFESVLCFPVAIVEDIDAAIAEAIRNKEPPRHWRAQEMPVICALKSGHLHYFEGTPTLNALFWNYFREMIRKMLSP